MDYLNKENDFLKAKNKLKVFGIEVNRGCNNTEKNIVNNIRSAYDHVDAWEVNIDTYVVKRSSQTYYRIFSEWEFEDIETGGHEATYDVVGIYWDSDKANYYDYSVCDRYIASLKDSSQYSHGTILFNSYDGRFEKDEAYWVAVYVTPEDYDSIDYGTKYVHTYTDTDQTVTGSAGISWGGTGIVEGSIGFDVELKNYEAKWEKSDSNAFNPS